MINILIAILIAAVLGILIVNTRIKGIITLLTVGIFGLTSSYIAISALSGTSYEIILSGTHLFGNVPVRIDSLSAWFILTINFTIITGSVYGFNYMKGYRNRKGDITLHCISFVVAHFSLLSICAVQNGFTFLLFWELMAISMFVHPSPGMIVSARGPPTQPQVSLKVVECLPCTPRRISRQPGLALLPSPPIHFTTITCTWG